MRKQPLIMFLKAGVTGGLIATALNLILFYLARQLGALEFIVPQGPDRVLTPLTEWPIVFSSLIPAIIAAILLTILVKATRYAIPVFFTIAIVILIASFWMPITQAQATAEKVILSMMHIMTASAIMWQLIKKAKQIGAEQPISPAPATK